MQRAVQMGVFLMLVSLLIVGAHFVHPSVVGKTIIPTRVIEIGGQKIDVAIADTEALRQNGLSFYDHLQDDKGMLFVFSEDGKYSFWMKDMRFSIDIMWLDAEGRVIHIEKSVSPDTFPQSFTPDSPARYVLEVRAGFAEKYNIQIGTRATLE